MSARGEAQGRRFVPRDAEAAFARSGAGRWRVVLTKSGGAHPSADPERDALEAWADELNDEAEREEICLLTGGGNPPMPAQGG